MLMHESFVWLVLVNWFSDAGTVYQLFATSNVMVNQSCMSSKIVIFCEIFTA